MQHGQTNTNRLSIEADLKAAKDEINAKIVPTLATRNVSIEDLFERCDHTAKYFDEQIEVVRNLADTIIKSLEHAASTVRAVGAKYTTEITRDLDRFKKLREDSEKAIKEFIPAKGEDGGTKTA